MEHDNITDIYTYLRLRSPPHKRICVEHGERGWKSKLKPSIYFQIRPNLSLRSSDSERSAAEDVQLWPKLREYDKNSFHSLCLCESPAVSTIRRRTGFITTSRSNRRSIPRWMSGAPSRPTKST